MEEVREICQIGTMVDHTTKTRFIFDINKGSNINPDLDVNAKMRPEDRRIPIENMIYIADGPSDIPVFSVVRNNSGRAYAVYNPDNPEEFKQNDNLLQTDRVNACGPTNYASPSYTHTWIKMHLQQICDRIVKDHQYALANRVTDPPRHLHKEKEAVEPDEPHQDSMLE